jgi:competence protein ComEC
VVPHHGSDTSSVAEFVAALSPGIAIASTAYKGRWNLPNQQVVSRYEKSGANWFDTGHDGQITVKFYPNHTSVRSLRRLKGQTWYRQMLRKGVE